MQTDWNATCSPEWPDRADPQVLLTPTARTLGYLGCPVLGLAVGIMGAFVQAHRLVFPLGSLIVAIPWGALLVLLAVVTLTRSACWVVGSRLAGFLLVAGWLASTLWFAMESGSGNLAISAGARQWGYVIGGTLLGSAAFLLPMTRRLPVLARSADRLP